MGESSAGCLQDGVPSEERRQGLSFRVQKMAGNQWVKRAQLGDSGCGFRSVQYAANVLLAGVFWGVLSKKLVLCQSLKLGFTVIPAQAGIQIAALDSRLRGNDVTQKLRFDKALGSFVYAAS